MCSFTDYLFECEALVGIYLLCSLMSNVMCLYSNLFKVVITALILHKAVLDLHGVDVGHGYPAVTSAGTDADHLKSSIHICATVKWIYLNCQMDDSCCIYHLLDHNKTVMHSLSMSQIFFFKFRSAPAVLFLNRSQF